MIALYCREEGTGERLAEALKGCWVACTGDAAEFRHLVAVASCCVVVLPGAVDASEWFAWGALAGRHRAPGWIVVTEFRSTNAPGMNELTGFASVISLDEAPHALPKLVARWLRPHPLDELARLIQEDTRLPSGLRRGLGTACGIRPPPRSVFALARAAGVTEGCLRAHWRRAMPRDTNPKGLVEWMVLAHAVWLRADAPSWCEVANRLRISQATLQAVSRRRTGLPPGQIWAGVDRTLREKLADWWRGTG